MSHYVVESSIDYFHSTRVPLLFPRAPARKQTKQPAEEITHPPEPSTSPSPTVTELPPPPANSFQLEADLRKIGNQPEVIYRYLRVSLSLSFTGDRIIFGRSDSIIICCQHSSGIDNAGVNMQIKPSQECSMLNLL